MQEVVMQGVVNHFHPQRGFGFIRPSPTAPDIFFHASELVSGEESQLTRGIRVEFILGWNRGKQVARNIKIIAPAPAPTGRTGEGGAR